MRHIIPGLPNPYTGGRLDRAGHLRNDDDWMAAALNAPTSRFVLFWRGNALLSGVADGAPRAQYRERPALDSPWVFLGLQDDLPIFAADISSMDEPGEGFENMRGLAASLPVDDATILATARAMLHWRGQNGFCARCGGHNLPVRGGYVLRCETCETQHFPRSDPAVIMLVAQKDRVLLGQSLRFAPERRMYSTLAGFVEPGESLEDAVRREVMEEVGVKVGDVMYHSSQPWPFPASLMLGYYAEALTEEITLQEDEMRDAKWFTRADLENREALGFNLPMGDSIARRLIEDWLAQT